MLFSKTEDLIKELNKYKSLQESSNESKVYIKRSTNLKAIVMYVQTMSEIVSLFKRQNFIIEIDSIINHPNELFKTLYKNWADDKKSIIERNDFFTRVNWAEINNKLEVILYKQWEEYIDDNKPNINKATLDVFEKIPDFSSVVRNLKEKLELLNEHKNTLPTNDGDFELIISISLEMNTLLKQLESKNIPDSVIRFLKKAVDGIDLSEITSEILEWLKDNNLIHLCQVKFRK